MASLNDVAFVDGELPTLPALRLMLHGAGVVQSLDALIPGVYLLIDNPTIKYDVQIAMVRGLHKVLINLPREFAVETILTLCSSDRNATRQEYWIIIMDCALKLASVGANRRKGLLKGAARAARRLTEAAPGALVDRTIEAVTISRKNLIPYHLIDSDSRHVTDVIDELADGQVLRLENFFMLASLVFEHRVNDAAIKVVVKSLFVEILPLLSAQQFAYYLCAAGAQDGWTAWNEALVEAWLRVEQPYNRPSANLLVNWLADVILGQELQPRSPSMAWGALLMHFRFRPPSSGSS